MKDMPIKAQIVCHDDRNTSEPRLEWIDMIFVDGNTDEYHARMFELWSLLVQERYKNEIQKGKSLAQQCHSSVAEANAVAEAESGSPMRLHQQKNNGRKEV